MNLIKYLNGNNSLVTSYELIFPGYAEHYDVISDDLYRDQWFLCFIPFVSLNGTESQEVGCG